MAAGIPTANCAFMVTGVYRIPNVHVDTLGVLTNTAASWNSCWGSTAASSLISRPV